jgi:actin-related protein
MSLKLKHDRELEEMQKQYGKKKEFAELEKQLLIQQDAEKTALLDEQNKVKSEKEKEEQNKKFEDQKAFIEADLIRAEEDFNLKQQKRIELENKDFEIQMANTELSNGQRELLKAQHEANLVGIAKESADRQKQIDEATKQSKMELMNAVGSIFGELAGLSKQASGVQKAFAITQVAIDTATALSGLTSISFSPTNGDNIVNPLGPYIKLATGTAKIISNMSRVKQILGSGVQVAPPTTGGGPTANLGIGATQGTQQNIQAQSTYKVVVVDSDITKMQDKTKKVNAISTI